MGVRRDVANIDLSNVVVKNTFLDFKESADIDDDPWLVDPTNCRRQKTDSLIDRSSLSRQRELENNLGHMELTDEVVHAMATLGLKRFMNMEEGSGSDEAGEPETELPCPEPGASAVAPMTRSPMPMSGPIIPVPGGMGEYTTVMIRNIPCKYTQAKLMREINGAGFLGRFDFIYLPMDPRSKANRGFAFCNFDCPQNAELFYQTYHGKKLRHFASDKVVEVVPADVQGFEDNAEHYLSARANGRIRSSHSRPLFLRPLPAHLTMGADEHEPQTQTRQAESAALASSFETSMMQSQMMACRMMMGQMAMSGPAAPFSAPTALPPGMPSVLPGQSQGSSAAAAAAQPPPAAAGGAKGMRFCPYCGKEKSTDFTFCPYCGSQQPSV